jgi:hypothetical protein
VWGTVVWGNVLWGTAVWVNVLWENIVWGEYVEPILTVGASLFFSACKMGLFTLPSGAKFCHVSMDVSLPYDDADAFCKKIGLSGLFEPESGPDYVYFAGVNNCE